MNTPWERLKNERERLGLSQKAFAEMGGVHRRSQLNYEKGERKPDTKYLEGIAAAGADVAYILTGTPKALREALEDVRGSTELAGALGGSDHDARNNQSAIFQGLRKARTDRADEEALLEEYRSCTPADQIVIRQMIARFAEAATAKMPVRKKRKTA